MSKVRILQVISAYYPAVSFGGPVFKAQAIAERLVRRGHDVEVVTSNLLGPGERMSDRTLVEDVNGVHVTYLKTWAQWGQVPVNPGIAGFCRRHVHDFDAIHLYGFYDLLGATVGYYARRGRVPYVIEPMGMYVPIVRSLGWKRVYHALLGNTLVAGAARIVATAKQERDELVGAGLDAARIVVRRNGIDLAPFAQRPAPGQFRRRLGLEPGEKVILYLSRLSPKKSPDLLLRAFAELNAPQARLVIAGPAENDGYAGELHTLAARLGLERRVVFPGPLYGEDKVAAYADADVFVLPSQNENFGNVVAESIAAGTPVIVTDRCGVAPYVRDRAGLVIPHDREALRQALANLLVNHSLREDFAQNCASVAADLSWDEPVAEMEALYSSL